ECLTLLSTPLGSVPFLSSERRPGFVQIIAGRVCADELETYDSRAIGQWFDAPDDGVHIVAGFRKTVAAQLCRQGQCDVYHQAVLNASSHAKRNAHSADIDCLGHFLPLPV